MKNKYFKNTRRIDEKRLEIIAWKTDKTIYPTVSIIPWVVYRSH